MPQRKEDKGGQECSPLFTNCREEVFSETQHSPGPIGLATGARGIVDLPFGALSYQGSLCVLGVTAYRSCRLAPQAPRTTTPIVDIHLYWITVGAPRPRHHPTKSCLLKCHPDSPLLVIPCRRRREVPLGNSLGHNKRKRGPGNCPRFPSPSPFPQGLNIADQQTDVSTGGH